MGRKGPFFYAYLFTKEHKTRDTGRIFDYPDKFKGL